MRQVCGEDIGLVAPSHEEMSPKTHAEDVATELRGEMGVGSGDRMDCTALAGHLAIEVVP